MYTYIYTYISISAWMMTARAQDMPTGIRVERPLSLSLSRSLSLSPSLPLSGGSNTGQARSALLLKLTEGPLLLTLDFGRGEHHQQCDVNYREIRRDR